MRRIWGVALPLVVAGLAGYVGGRVANTRVIEAAAGPIRSTQFELVDQSGSVVGRWRFVNNAASLQFLGKSGTPVASVGTWSDGRPFLELFGRDGKSRVAIELTVDDKPVLSLSDDRWQGRALLGFLEPDTRTPEWDNWGLLFRLPGSDRPIASMSMLNMQGQTPEGAITLSGQRIR